MPLRNQEQIKTKTRTLTHIGPYAPWTRWPVMKTSILRVQNKTSIKRFFLHLYSFACYLPCHSRKGDTKRTRWYIWRFLISCYFPEYFYFELSWSFIDILSFPIVCFYGFSECMFVTVFFMFVGFVLFWFVHYFVIIYLFVFQRERERRGRVGWVWSMRR